MSILDTLTQHGVAGGLPDPLPAEPFQLLSKWHARAVADANAMVLATSTPNGRPSARVVLCKAIEPDTTSLVFYTNYASRKAEELDSNPHAACVFYWDHLHLQARVEGRVERVSERESDEYFASRPPPLSHRRRGE